VIPQPMAEPCSADPPRVLSRGYGTDYAFDSSSLRVARHYFKSPLQYRKGPFWCLQLANS
jgi:hypothetical protein